MKAKVCCVLVCSLFLAGCSAETPVGSVDTRLSEVSHEEVSSDIPIESEDTAVSNVSYGSGSPEDLFDRFLNGEIDAEPLQSSPLVDGGGSININDLNMDPEEWTFESFSVGEQIDLDNDGENELILDGPYGGMYLDAIDGELYIFARALGNAGALSHTYYDDAMWIVISDTTHAGRLYYEFFKFEGGDDLVDRMSLLAENYYEDQEGVYTFNDESITEEEFNTLHDEIFGK
ncbi:MAG: hypothetical protein J5685_09925 [Clostridiales bacterium]|nr:hypothetical protein [Clostridiales bacterium]